MMIIPFPYDYSVLLFEDRLGFELGFDLESQGVEKPSGNSLKSFWSLSSCQTITSSVSGIPFPYFSLTRMDRCFGRHVGGALSVDNKFPHFGKLLCLGWFPPHRLGAGHLILSFLGC